MPTPQTQDVSATRMIPNSRVRQEGPQKVFVYGTLKMGYHNHKRYLSDAKYLGEASTEGIMFHLGGFPAINISEAFGPIVGEVWECDWDAVVAMDRLEGIDNGFYDRIKLIVRPHGTVWSYIFPKSRATLEQFVIPTGNWKGHDTVKVRWLGFGKGIELGAFVTNSESQEIAVGPGSTGDYNLVRSGSDGMYRLINKNSGEVHGPYKVLKDLIATSHRQVLQLPRAKPEMPALVTAAIQKELSIYDPPDRRTIPTIWVPPETQKSTKTEAKKEDVPQAARLLNLKYGAA